MNRLFLSVTATLHAIALSSSFGIAQTIDYAVSVSDYFADVKVQIVDYFADEKWELVGFCSNSPNLKVELVDYFADLKVEIVDYFADKKFCITNPRDLDEDDLRALKLAD